MSSLRIGAEHQGSSATHPLTNTTIASFACAERFQQRRHVVRQLLFIAGHVRPRRISIDRPNGEPSRPMCMHIFSYPTSSALAPPPPPSLREEISPVRKIVSFSPINTPSSHLHMETLSSDHGHPPWAGARRRHVASCEGCAVFPMSASLPNTTPAGPGTRLSAVSLALARSRPP
jgi:hypothetical protein